MMASRRLDDGERLQLATLNPTWARSVRPLGEYARSTTTRRPWEGRPARRVQRFLQQWSARGNAHAAPH